MSFDMRVSNQAGILEDRIKSSLYKGLYEASQKTGWVRLSGFPVGIISGLMNIVTRIALIAESIFKGFGNLLGAPFTDKCSAKEGLKNLFIQLPKNILLIPFTIIASALRPLGHTFAILLAPEAYSLQLWGLHDPVKKQQLDDEKKQKDEQKKVLEAEVPNLAPNLNAI